MSGLLVTRLVLSPGLMFSRPTSSSTARGVSATVHFTLTLRTALVTAPFALSLTITIFSCHESLSPQRESTGFSLYVLGVY
jgi:hypothetical protein